MLRVRRFRKNVPENCSRTLAPFRPGLKIARHHSGTCVVDRFVSFPVSRRRKTRKTAWNTCFRDLEASTNQRRASAGPTVIGRFLPRLPRYRVFPNRSSNLKKLFFVFFCVCKRPKKKRQKRNQKITKWPPVVFGQAPNKHCGSRGSIFSNAQHVLPHQPDPVAFLLFSVKKKFGQHQEMDHYKTINVEKSKTQ